MNCSAVLSFVQNSLNGDITYDVTARLQKLHQPPAQVIGKLPSANTVFNVYKEWQIFYESLLQITRQPSLEITIDPTGFTNISLTDFDTLCETLKETINTWLHSPEFASINRQILTYFNRNDEILLIIETDDQQLARLPLHLWDFFETFEAAELILSNLQFIHPLIRNYQRDKIRILAIFGETNDLDLEKHKEVLKELENESSIELVVIPKNETNLKNINEKLWDKKGWSVIFFAGHGKGGTIQINPKERISINLLEKGLREATKNGLQLLIFNSCDGIGLAKTALQYKVPRVIVFREKVPNEVAANFIRYFLNAFQRESLPLALREARERLQGLEDEFPLASWLPLLCKNAAIPILTWEMLQGNKPDNPTFLNKLKNFFKKYKKPLRFSLLLIITLLIIFLIYTYRKPIQLIETCKLTPENRLLSCGEKSLMKTPPTELNKRKGIEEFANKNFDQAIKSLQTSFDNNKDGETLIFLNNAQVLQKLKLGKINQNQVIPLAVVIPITKQKDGPDQVSKHTLKGIGYKQKEFNENNNQNQVLILVANDENNVGDNKTEGIAQYIAKELVKRKLYGVIGHYSSRATINTKDTYKKAQLVLMSFASTANEVTLKNNQKLTLTDTSQQTYFFRVVSTNKDQTQLLAQYLQNKGYQKVVIFYSEKIFSLSFKQEFEKNWSKHSVIKTYNLEEKIDIKSILENLKKRKEKIALILCPDAFTNNSATSLEISNTKDIIKENNGKFLIGTGNVMTLYEESIHTENTNIAKNIVISVPWSDYSEKINQNQRKQINELKKFWGNNLLNEEIVRQVIDYDSTKVLLDALSQIKPPLSSSKLQKYLVNPNNKFDGMSGEITFQGSDRLQNTAILITPNCDENSCQGWQKEWE